MPGTTGVRAFAVRPTAAPSVGLVLPRVHPALPPARAGSSTTPTEIWDAVQATLAELGAALADAAEPSPPSASPTSARRRWRGTAAPGEPLHRAIVWQDRRTAGPLRRAPRRPATSPLVRAHHRPRARPVLLGHQARVAARPRAASRPDADLAFGTIDSWLLWNLTGGRRRPRHRAVERQPHDALRHPDAGLVGRAVRPVRRAASTRSPEVRPSSGRFGVTADGARRRRRRHPGQRHRRRPAGGAVRPGLLRAGHDQEHLRHRLVRADERRRPLPRAGRRPAHHRRLDHPRPGATASPHALRARGRHLRHRRRRAVAARRPRHHRRGRRDRAARRVDRPTPTASCLVPAFTGLGSPWWDPYARGTIVGITRGTGRAHLARAVVEAMAFQTRDVVEAMTAASGHAVAALRADGGAVGHATCCCSSRPTSSQVPVAPARRARRPPRSAPPTWPAWPRASGARPPTIAANWVLDARGRARPPTAPPPTRPTPGGCRAVERAAATGPTD